jgi:hypothetical protein
LSNINQIIASIITAGGLGYVNYWVIDKLGLTASSSEDKAIHITLSSLLFSIPDFAVYLLIQQCLIRWTKIRGNWFIICSIIITLILVFLITLFLSKIAINCIYKFVRLIKTGSSSTGIAYGEPWNDLLEKGKSSIAYIYDINHNPLSFGYVDTYSADVDGNYSVNLKPIMEEGTQPSYSKLLKQLQNDDFSHYDYNIYVNLKQKFIIIMLVANN